MSFSFGLGVSLVYLQAGDSKTTSLLYTLYILYDTHGLYDSIYLIGIRTWWWSFFPFPIVSFYTHGAECTAAQQSADVKRGWSQYSTNIRLYDTPIERGRRREKQPKILYIRIERSSIIGSSRWTALSPMLLILAVKCYGRHTVYGTGHNSAVCVCVCVGFAFSLLFFLSRARKREKEVV